MKNQGVLIVFLFFAFRLGAEGDLNEASKRAQVYAETDNYSKAVDLYSQLFNDSLQPWQIARLHYNLGLLKLAQKQSKEALDEFLQIHPMELSSPQNVRNLFFYEAIAYLQQADDLKSVNQSFAREKQSYLLNKSLKVLEKAKIASCSIYTNVNEDLKCEPSILIKTTENIVKQSLHNIENKSMEQEPPPKEVNGFALKQLKIAQNQAIVSLKMAYQLDLLADFSQNQKNKSQLYQQQQLTVEAGNAFIPAVLKDQEKEFIHKDPRASCLISKWSEVISLFDLGYQSAKNSLMFLSKDSNFIQGIIIFNELTVQYWQRAIDLLFLPPQSGSPDTVNQQSDSIENMNETIRELQEMFFQDQMEKPIRAPQKELLSW